MFIHRLFNLKIYPRISLSSLDRRILFGNLIIVSLIVINIIRAYQQSITHDEALTYRMFVHHGWRNILWSFHSNNHVFNSLLIKIAIWIFGVSHFTLRIPALIGGFLYLLAAERLCRTFCRSISGYVLILLALTTSPFILDYLSIARGYSLALGLFMTAFVLCWLEIQDENKGTCFRRYFIISCLCALSAASNLSFAFLNASLITAFLLFLSLKEYSFRRSVEFPKLRNSLLSLIVPGAILFICINPAIFKYNSDTMYYGSQSWKIAYKSILIPLFDGFSPKLGTPLWREYMAQIAHYIPLFFLIIILLGSIYFLKGYIIRQSDGFYALDDHLKLWGFITSILLILIGMHSAMHSALGVLLPKERTGIYFVPLSILLISVLIEGFQRGVFPKIFRILGRIGLLITVLYFLSCFHFMYFRQWVYDSGTKDIFLYLQSLGEDHKNSGIGINFLLEPSLNFYRDNQYKAYTLPEFTREGPNKKQALFVLLPSWSDTDRIFIKKHSLKVRYQHSFSGAVVMIKE